MSDRPLRRMKSVPVRALFGEPHVRDPDFICRDFEPGERVPTATCESDGHYLCKECRWLVKVPE